MEIYVMIRVVYKRLDCQSAAFGLRPHAGQIVDLERNQTFYNLVHKGLDQLISAGFI